jgi:hypothetical protein
MWDAINLLLSLRALEQFAREGAPVVPEPEFKPFVFPKRNAAPGMTAANSTQHPKSLEELGVPRQFAHELEATFRAMGAMDGDRVVGFTFRTPDGVAHPLCAGGRTEEVAPANRADSADKAA